MRESNIPLNRLPAVCECKAHGFVLLTRGFVTFFSPEKLPLVAGRKWVHANVGPKSNPKQYAVCRVGRDTIYMHRVLTGAAEDVQADHKDRNGLNNQQENLRVCTQGGNSQNRGLFRNKAVPFKGVSRCREGFRAHICCEGKKWHIGRFSCPVDAARAYDRAALDLHQSFACTNVMLGLLPPEDAPSAPRDLFSS